jgi:hypothetical protein
MGGGSQPQPPSPTESAQAQASSQLAGEMFQAQNAPQLAYEDALVRSQFQPFETSLLSGLSARSAAQGASANQAIQYNTNPQAYQGRQMAMQGANARMGSLYGVDPNQYSYKDDSAFGMPSTSQLPDFNSVAAMSRAFGSNLGSVNIGSGGAVTPMAPKNPIPFYLR